MEPFVNNAYFSRDFLRKTDHYHDCHQILYITGGTVEIYVNNVKHIASKGSIVIFSRYEHHSIRVLSDEYERFVLEIDPFTSRTDNKLFAILSNRPDGFENIMDVSKYETEFESIFHKIVSEAHSAYVLSHEMLELLVKELLIMLYRHIPETSVFWEEEQFDIVFDLQKRFETEYEKNYSLEALAKEYHISTSSLSHLFKKMTGSSVMGYLLACRIASAENLLTETNMDIGEIVEKCGFSDNSNFSRTFKKLNQMTPTDFRRKYGHFCKKGHH